MSTDGLLKALNDSQRYLDVVHKPRLSKSESEWLIETTISNFAKYYNSGFIEYRKSVAEAGDYASVEWTGRGATFKDVLGREYIDCLGGFGVFNLGWTHPKVVRAVQAQLEKSPLPTQELLDPLRGMLAHLLAEITPGDIQYSFFVGSGTEAVEGAMKLAKLYTRKSGFIASVGGFHGKTTGSLSLTGKAIFRKPAMPLHNNIFHVPYGDADAVEQQLRIAREVGNDADYNEPRAQEVASMLKSSRLCVQQIDVNDEERLDALLHGADVVLSAVEYVYNLPILKACIRKKVHYADLGGLFHMSRKLLVMNDEVEAAGITAILGTGGTPGITNLLARMAVDTLDSVESIKVQLGCGDETRSTAPLVAPYSIRTILDEFTKSPQVFENGTWYAQQPLSGQEELVFPAPIGRATAIYSLHSECATFPVSFQDKGIRYVSFKIAFPNDFLTKLKFLVDLGFGSDELMSVQGVKVSPREVLARLLEIAPGEEVEPRDCDVLRIVATGQANGRQLELVNQVVVHPYLPWGIGACALDTGTPLAIAGRMLARGEITKRGAFGPEMCVPTDIFFREAARYNMHVESQLHTA